MKQRHGFVSNSSSSSFIIACDKGKRNDEDIKFEMKVSLSEISDKVIVTKAQLDEYYFKDNYYGSYEKMDNEEQKQYNKLLRLINKGQKLFMCSVSSDSGEAKEAAIRECGEGNIVLPDGFKQIGGWRG